MGVAVREPLGSEARSGATTLTAEAFAKVPERPGGLPKETHRNNRKGAGVMEWLHDLLDNGTTPVLTAFLLGLLTAVSPCPLAANITAIGFIGKNIGSRRQLFAKGVLYTLGASRLTPCWASC